MELKKFFFYKLPHFSHVDVNVEELFANMTERQKYRREILDIGFVMAADSSEAHDKIVSGYFTRADSATFREAPKVDFYCDDRVIMKPGAVDRLRVKDRPKGRANADMPTSRQYYLKCLLECDGDVGTVESVGWNIKGEADVVVNFPKHSVHVPPDELELRTS